MVFGLSGACEPASLPQVQANVTFAKLSDIANCAPKHFLTVTYFFGRCFTFATLLEVK